MPLVIQLPYIDPVIFEIGPVAIRWYAVAYMAGLLIGWRYMRALARRPPPVADARAVDDFLLWAIIGVVLGGRVGYVLFYNLPYYLDQPLAMLKVWQGGMSFHGGLLGVVVATVLYARRRGVGVLAFGDLVACAAPIGLFLGRLANFVNGELVGRPADVPWAMVFRDAGPLPRHPSQLYEAALEGIALFVILNLLWRREDVRGRPGTLLGTFLVGYAVFRSIGELFRQPDAHIGFLGGGTTMGQWLSLPMAVIGLDLIVRARSAPRPEQ